MILEGLGLVYEGTESNKKKTPQMRLDFLKIQWDLLTMIGKSIILKINNIKLL